MKPIDIVTGGHHSRSIKERRCVFCKSYVAHNSFRDALSEKDFNITGMCQYCQDDLYDSPEDVDTNPENEFTDFVIDVVSDTIVKEGHNVDHDSGDEDDSDTI